MSIESQEPQVKPVAPPTVQGKNGPDFDLVKIASRQKRLLVCILIYLLAAASLFLVPLSVRPIIGTIMFVACVIAAIYSGLLAAELYNKVGTGVLIGILTWVPFLGLVLLLVINAKATTLLKNSGLKVGLLGVKGSPPVV